MTKRVKPNILVTGTPGCGKTTLCELVAMVCDVEFINITDLIKQKGFIQGYDETYQSDILNEDALLDELEDRLGGDQGGYIIDYHGCDFFPERWFDYVIVLTTDIRLLADRLSARGYSEKKLEGNLQCEIMEVILSEAHESYKCVHPLISNTVTDMENNVAFIENLFNSFIL